MDTEKISVIIPVYNTKRFLKKSVQSIINQTYKNLEIILVDNGSTDGCTEICKRFKKKDNRIKVIKKEHGSAASGRNVGISTVTGDYILFVDSDDWMRKDGIELLYARMKETGADYCHASYVTMQEVRNIPQAYPSRINCTKSDASDFCRLVHSTMFAPWMTLFKNNIIYENSITFNEDALLAEDVIFVETYMQYCTHFASLEAPIYFYNKIFAGSVSQRYYPKLCIWYFEAAERLYGIYDGIDIPIQVQYCFNARVLGWFIRLISDTASNNDIGEFQHRMQLFVEQFAKFSPWKSAIGEDIKDETTKYYKEIQKKIRDCIEKDDYSVLYSMYSSTETNGEIYKQRLKKVIAKFRMLYYFHRF